MPAQRGRPGPALPYDLLAGVVPCQKGWVVASGKLVGISLHPETPTMVRTFAEVIDHIPSYVVIAVYTPIGLGLKWTERGRTCDREARELVGWPHLGAIASPPGRKDLAAGAKSSVGDVVTRRMARAINEVDEQMQPYRQRSVYAVHPELSFYQLNGDQPPQYSKQSAAGVRERRELLLRRLNGSERVLNEDLPGTTQGNLLDAVASLWTARRIVAKAATRLPEDPEWDDEGLRMEWVR
jgi:predicted RNase H-like nuclease